MSDHKLVETVLYLHKQLERAADRLDMTMSQYFMLHFLHEEPRRAHEFTVVSKLRKPGITALVGRLEERGWVERTPDPEDGRAQIIRITAQGLDAFHGFEANMQAALESFLGEEAVREMDRLIEPFHAHWNEKRRERFNNWRRGRRDENTGDDARVAAGTDGPRGG